MAWAGWLVPFSSGLALGLVLVGLLCINIIERTAVQPKVGEWHSSKWVTW
jgi:hypothetical protein